MRHRTRPGADHRAASIARTHAALHGEAATTGPSDWEGAAIDAAPQPPRYRAGRTMPERELWRALLVDALNGAVHGRARSPGGSPASLSERVAADREWIDSDADYVGSFPWVCNVLGLDPDAVREAAHRGQVVHTFVVGGPQRGLRHAIVGRRRRRRRRKIA